MALFKAENRAAQIQVRLSLGRKRIINKVGRRIVSEDLTFLLV